MKRYTLSYELAEDERPWVIRRADRTIVFRLAEIDRYFAERTVARLNDPAAT